MTRFILLLLLCILSMQAFPQQGQLSISRINQMPDLPAPLYIRNWNTVAHDYDSYVFDLTKKGEYLPLSRLGTLGQFNYADNTPLFLDTYVGSADHSNSAEAINILPAVVEALVNKMVSVIASYTPNEPEGRLTLTCLTVPVGLKYR